MRTKILLNGIDRLILAQTAAGPHAPDHLHHLPALGDRLGDHGFECFRFNRNRGESVYHLLDLDLRVWRRGDGVGIEVHPGAEALTCRPRATWDLANGLYAALGDILGFSAYPHVKLLDLFIDTAGVRVSESFKSRLRHHPRLKVEDGNGWLRLGNPKRMYLYDKLRDALENPSKRYVLQLHRAAGWNGTDPITRIDMRFEGKRLRRHDRIDLNALRDEALSEVVLTRRAWSPKKEKSVRQEDGLWKRLKDAAFTPPWDSPPSTVRIPTYTLGERAHHAQQTAKWSLAVLALLAHEDPALLEPWSLALIQHLARSPGVCNAEFDDVIRKWARRLVLSEPDCALHRSDLVVAEQPQEECAGAHLE